MKLESLKNGKFEVIDRSILKSIKGGDFGQVTSGGRYTQTIIKQDGSSSSTTYNCTQDYQCPGQQREFLVNGRWIT